MQVWPSYKTPE